MQNFAATVSKPELNWQDAKLVTTSGEIRNTSHEFNKKMPDAARPDDLVGRGCWILVTGFWILDTGYPFNKNSDCWQIFPNGR
jgi:hypothetical protein